MHLHCLVVMEGKEIRGIVTQTDVFRAIRSAFDTTVSRQTALTIQLAERAPYVMQNMEELPESLSAIRNRWTHSDTPTATASPPGSQPTDVDSNTFCILSTQPWADRVGPQPAYA